MRVAVEPAVCAEDVVEPDFGDVDVVEEAVVAPEEVVVIGPVVDDVPAGAVVVDDDEVTPPFGAALSAPHPTATRRTTTAVIVLRMIGETWRTDRCIDRCYAGAFVRLRDAGCRLAALIRNGGQRRPAMTLMALATITVPKR